jgi:sucrose-6-phosphate hydrolase SacC (GH32 family)
VTEVESLRRQSQPIELPPAAGEHALPGTKGELFDLVAEIEPGAAQALGFTLRGVPLRYDVAQQTLTCRQVSAKVPLAEGRLKLRVLVDRGSIEVFANDGAAALSIGGVLDPAETSLAWFVEGGAARRAQATVYSMASAWRD